MPRAIQSLGHAMSSYLSVRLDNIIWRRTRTSAQSYLNRRNRVEAAQQSGEKTVTWRSQGRSPDHTFGPAHISLDHMYLSGQAGGETAFAAYGHRPSS
jgi:hypothetical protein